MTTPGDQEDLDAVMRRMADELGPRRPAPGEPAPPGAGPPAGPARPGPAVFGGPPPRPAPRRRALATTVLLWAIGLVYLLSCLLSGNVVQPNFVVLALLGAKINELIADGAYWRLISATFLHANLVHILFNGFALYSLGPEAERIYGTRRFLAIYFLAGLGGSVASYLISPSPAVGASGAVFGLIGALGIFFYLSRRALGEFGRLQVQSMAGIAVINLIIGFASQGTIDNWGHMGGLAAGLAAGAALAPRLTIDDRFYPPVISRRLPELGWPMAAGLLLLLAALALLLPPAS